MFRTLKKIVLNKYFIVLLTFGVYVTFFDEHDLVSRWRTHKNIVQLKNEIQFYQRTIRESKQKKIELQSNNKNLEKFAREQYLMKKKNEDIFVVQE